MEKKKPITITIDPEQDKKLRKIQAKLLTSTNSHWSYSKVISLILEDGLDNFSISKVKKVSR